MQRDYGCYSSRTRGARRRQPPDATEAPVAIVDPVDWTLRAARVRWAELLRRIFEVDPLACPRCQGLMQIVALITDPAVIVRILTHRARVRDSPHRPGHPPPRRRRAPTSTAAAPPHP
jgi:hypothetical protein